jgi:5-oxoprolinase (ATP-hydrolysing) subunit A|tara:strand:+ start:924 stop:1697 length:774 start_codon:yes stop_codon:yes gene_type:complete
MEININCDLGESSKLHSTKNDTLLLNIVNSANIACGYHAGDLATMEKTIEISKSNNVSIGAHPSFKDLENFGRKRMNLPPKEITKLIVDQISVLEEVASKKDMKITHIKPHGALNNMACESYELAKIISQTIINVNKDLIFLVPTGSQMEKVAIELDMKIAAEIFADRNYEDDGNLISRKKSNAMIIDPEIAKKHVSKMIENQSINCYSGKQIPCKIDSVCVHGDEIRAVNTANLVKNELVKLGISLMPLDKMKKFL